MRENADGARCASCRSWSCRSCWSWVDRKPHGPTQHTAPGRQGSSRPLKGALENKGHFPLLHGGFRAPEHKFSFVITEKAHFVMGKMRPENLFNQELWADKQKHTPASSRQRMAPRLPETPGQGCSHTCTCCPSTVTGTSRPSTPKVREGLWTRFFTTRHPWAFWYRCPNCVSIGTTFN